MSPIVAIAIGMVVAVVVGVILFRYVLAHRDDPAKRARATIVAWVVIMAIDIPLVLLAFLAFLR